MSLLVVIPARHASSRFPGKPLVALYGPDGDKTLIRRSWEAACRIDGADRVVVATDDARIADHAAGFGADVVMTSDTCRNGSERCAEVARTLPDHDLIVNYQGDGPLVPPGFAAPLVQALKDNPAVALATPVLCAGPEVRAMLLADQARGLAGGTTAVMGADGRALYFSKAVLPRTVDPSVPIHHHLGLYAYRRAALLAYAEWPEGPLERCEGLEQLRFLEHGAPVQCVVMQDPGHEIWEVNNPPDVARVEAILARIL
jgi:3-deoxy-manno-octulosonate cytidylyltransferase (CMP-KDO synthetase)